jgi:hypothetical protein
MKGIEMVINNIHAEIDALTAAAPKRIDMVSVTTVPPTSQQEWSRASVIDRVHLCIGNWRTPA